MKNLFEQSTYQEIENRIDKLNAETKSQWGKMNVGQMLAHACEPLEYAVGNKHGKQSFIGKIFKPFAKNMFFNETPYKHNSPTAPEFKINPSAVKNFEVEKSRLKNLLKKFNTEGKNVAGNQAHLFLGKITADEWARTMYKHLDHHLSQFGA
jgi:Protein of unknown function (DUF1569)